MGKVKSTFVCQNCGSKSSKWVGKCPSCGEWNTFAEEVIKVSSPVEKIISGTILKINDQHITVDIGYKSEGQIPKEEFLNTGSSDDLKTGQVLIVIVILTLVVTFIMSIINSYWGDSKNE